MLGEYLNLCVNICSLQLIEASFADCRYTGLAHSDTKLLAPSGRQSVGVPGVYPH